MNIFDRSDPLKLSLSHLKHLITQITSGIDTLTNVNIGKHKYNKRI